MALLDLLSAGGSVSPSSSSGPITSRVSTGSKVFAPVPVRPNFNLSTDPVGSLRLGNDPLTATGAASRLAVPALLIGLAIVGLFVLGKK